MSKKQKRQIFSVILASFLIILMSATYVFADIYEFDRQNGKATGSSEGGGGGSERMVRCNWFGCET